jgi:hypothetical protein
MAVSARVLAVVPADAPLPPAPIGGNVTVVTL